MDIGHCPACLRPYSAGEVTGFGILRPRPAWRGGPLVEFRCPGCSRLLRLVPHGHGRFAPPGEPPPPAVPEDERRPPWLTEERQAPRREPETASPPPRRKAKGPAPKAVAHDAPPPGASPEEALSVLAALELLGLEPTADRRAIDRAYRERSLACHPDKVAHLDGEFQALAEKKFRRLKEAYELLIS